MKIAVDVMGTDFGPGEIVLGALQAVKEYGCQVVLLSLHKASQRYKELPLKQVVNLPLVIFVR